MNATIQESEDSNSFDFNTLSVIITSSLLVISEILPFINIIKANGILDFLKITIEKLKKKKQPELPEKENKESTQDTQNNYSKIINKLDEISSRLNTQNCNIEVINDSPTKISIEFP
jgi:hypothetical protein